MKITTDGFARTSIAELRPPPVRVRKGRPVGRCWGQKGGFDWDSPRRLSTSMESASISQSFFLWPTPASVEYQPSSRRGQRNSADHQDGDRPDNIHRRFDASLLHTRSE